MTDLKSKTATATHQWMGKVAEFEVPQWNLISVIARGAIDKVWPVLDSFSPYNNAIASELEKRITKAKHLVEYGDMMAQFTQFRDQIFRVDAAYNSLLSQYDREVILPSTCALGIKKPTHFDIDEMGKLGVDRKFLYSNDVIAQVVEDLRQAGTGSDGDYHLSLPRGKNLGWPTPVSGRTRAQSDILLGVHALIAQLALNQGVSLQSVTEELVPSFGPAFAFAGQRLQHHGKPHMMLVRGEEYVTQSFEPRVRAIYMSPKYMVAYNRRWVKKILHAVMHHPLHTQDRAEITSRINHMMSSKYVIALDVSKFDQNHGRAIGDQLIRGLALVGASSKDEQERLYSSFKHEFTVQPLILSRRGVFLAPGGEILSSGVSMTSIMGCFASHALVYEILKTLRPGVTTKSFSASRGMSWDALTWGDDIVLAVSKDWFPSQEAFVNAIVKAGDYVKLEFTAEPTIKFLGQNYDMQGIQGSKAYPLSRFIQNTFFPERPKLDPFSTVGYIARLLLLDPAIQRDVHKFTRPFFQELKIRDFDFEQKDSMLRSILPEVEKFSQEISALDDVLNIFSHGLDPDDYDGAFPSEALTDLLALTRVDLSDPEKVISDAIANNNIDRYGAKRGLDLLKQGDLSAIHLIAQAIGSYQFNVNGSPIF